jgi:hypothetical protein
MTLLPITQPADPIAAPQPDHRVDHATAGAVAPAVRAALHADAARLGEPAPAAGRPDRPPLLRFLLCFLGLLVVASGLAAFSASADPGPAAAPGARPPAAAR